MRRRSTTPTRGIGIRDDLQRELEALVITEVDRVSRLSAAAPNDIPPAVGSAVYVGRGLGTHDR
mgnify:FL=1